MLLQLLHNCNSASNLMQYSFFLNFLFVHCVCFLKKSIISFKKCLKVWLPWRIVCVTNRNSIQCYQKWFPNFFWMVQHMSQLADQWRRTGQMLLKKMKTSNHHQISRVNHRCYTNRGCNFCDKWHLTIFNTYFLFFKAIHHHTALLYIPAIALSTCVNSGNP
jgi:hypothetical protein